MNSFKDRHFTGEVVFWAVGWCCQYGISYQDLEQMIAERGAQVDHATIYRWVQTYAPEMEKHLRGQWRRPVSRGWRVDETNLKVRGKWAYLHRAVNKFRNTIDFYRPPAMPRRQSHQLGEPREVWQPAIRSGGQARSGNSQKLYVSRSNF
jgi:transposase-like protein